MPLEFKSDKLIAFSLKLTKIHRAALPNAIRFALTDSAKDVKFRTLKKQANKSFAVKKQTFFRKFSGYTPAKGFNISKMQSVAGMIKGTPKNSKSVASTEIAQQQIAGTLHHKTFMASQNQRTSKGLVKSAYLKEREKTPIVTKKGKLFFADAKRAKETKRPLLVKKNNKGILVKVGKIRKSKTEKFKREIVTTPIASYRKGRKINLTDAKPFVNMAAIESAKILNMNFIKHAEKQVARYLR